jgi:hypothetical protein
MRALSDQFVSLGVAKPIINPLKLVKAKRRQGHFFPILCKAFNISSKGTAI